MADNKRPVTTLLIGLGGSGAWTATHVKRQLYDAYDNHIPKNIALAVLDTAAEVIVSVGSGTKVRQPGMGTGRVELSTTEIAHVGGDAYDLIREIDETDDYPHIKSWLLSKQFLETLPSASFNLDQGAGMFRQLGRMAMFRDVMSPSISSVANIIDNKLRGLKSMQRPNDPAISVIITGSLAGGTGAGMFIDIAHLVNRVATINNIKITLRGFFYLPQAFSKNLGPEDLEPAKGRAFAAMRELKRFILNSDYKYGYPMHYHSARSGINQTLWRSENQGKLYDFVYLIDGGGGTRMSNRKLEEGSAPAVADAIMAFLDENYGPKHEQYRVNTIGKIQNRQGEVGRKAFISTLGAYSIIMPIQQIIESWAYRLSRDLVNQIIPIEATSERGYVLKIDRKAIPEKSGYDTRDDISKIIKASLTDHLDPKGRTIVPLPLWAGIFELYNTPERKSQIEKKLGEYQLMDWLLMLLPPETQNDKETQSVLNEISKVLNDPIEDYVTPSSEIEGGDPSVDWLTIKNSTERYINGQLGEPASGGGRMGGAYRGAMTRLTAMQIKRFRDYLTSYIHHQLNGQGHQNVIHAKTGRFGWVIAIVEEFRAMFLGVNEHLTNLRAGAGGSNNMRDEAERAISDTLRNMQEKKDARRILPPRNAPAVEAQKQYIEAANQYVEYYRMEFARDEVSATLEGLGVVCAEVLNQFDIMTRVLATHNDSLHNQLLDGQNAVRGDRNQAADIANHRLIDDPEWEEGRYRQYVQSGVLEKLFQSWQWTCRLVDDEGEVHFELDWGITGQDSKIQNARRDINRTSSNWSRDNHDLIMEATRQVFRDAIQREGIVEYLMNEKDFDALAEELRQNSGLLLELQTNQAAAGYIPGNILLARPNVDAERGYLRDVLGKIPKGQGDTDAQESPTLIAESCDDPFRLTFLKTAELVPMESVKAYIECEEKYWLLPYDTRQKNHIFPAEVHAVSYEKDLARLLEQRQRTLSDRVALLLEDEQRYLSFLLLLAHNMIEQAEQQRDGIIETYWQLIAPEWQRRSGDIESWRLSDAAAKAPSLMEAAIQYILIGHDRTNPARLIPYERIMDSLEKKRETDTASRLKRDEVAKGNTNLRAMYEIFLPPLINGKEDLSKWTKRDDDLVLEVSKLIVRHDILHELVQDFRGYLVSLGKSAQDAQQKADNASSHNDALIKQELYDLFSISVVALEQQVTRHYDLIEDRYDIKTKDQKTRKLQ